MPQLFHVALATAVHSRKRDFKRVPRSADSAVNKQWATLLSAAVAICGLIMWMVSAEVARHRTHHVVAGFGVTLHSDPWPMFAHIPVAVALVPVLVLLLRVAIWRSHIQANLNAGGVPFPAGVASSAQGMGIAGARAHAGTADVPTSRGFFTAAGLAALATWLLRRLP